MYLLKYWDYETCLMTIEFEMEESSIPLTVGHNFNPPYTHTFLLAF